MAGLEQKRINALTVADNEFIDNLINKRDEAAKWYLPIDFCLEENPSDTDVGTKRVPASRVAFLTSSGLVPQSMLPTYISQKIEGDMVYADGNWTFTANDGTKYSCPNPGSDQTPSVEYVYVDNTPSDDYYQYRFIPAESPTATNVGTFSPIPSTLKSVDGNGTLITDDASNYTRQVDVNIGAPDTATGTSILELKNSKLIHTTSGVVAGSYGNSSDSTPAFGGTFKTVYETVNQTGHVTGLNQYTVTLPKTAATSTVYGLVKVGSNSDVKEIASAASIGSAKSDGYFLVAAADHTHKAANLTFTNTNEKTRNSFTYNGAADIDYDMVNILKTALPAVGPTNAKQVLSYDGTSAAWVDIDTLFVPNAITCSGTASSVSGTTAVVTLTTSDATSGSEFKLDTNVITGLVSGHAYIVTYNIQLVNATATAYMHNVKVVASNATGGTAYHHVNGSYLGKQYINGSFTVIATGTSTKLSLMNGESDSSNVFTSGSWSMTGLMVQVAEVK